MTIDQNRLEQARKIALDVYRETGDVKQASIKSGLNSLSLFRYLTIIDVSLLDSDGMDYVPRMKQLIADHGTAPAALRFLLDFYRAKKEDTSVQP